MATSLQQQLATIAINSTHQLDVKAQKSRHSKSLLFEPKDAAIQSFDTIFQLCLEGFEELCLLDSRYRPFASNIFSEQSKDEDRTQMTQRENNELDHILESYLRLVGGRLLLRPAMKTVEWLVRRFRVQDYNTECLLFTFLPYHANPMFSTLLSILPEQLPATFRFLVPYVGSLRNPPRNAIVSAVTTTQQLFTAFSSYVLDTAKVRHHSSILIGFWTSITAQSVNGLIDSSRSGRTAMRQQKEEDILLRLLPVISTALAYRDVQELYLAACMIMTILAAKASLSDHALDALMEATAESWTEATFEEGLSCLSIIAEEREGLSQKSAITRALLCNERTVNTLATLAHTQRVEKLAVLSILGALDIAPKKDPLLCTSFVFELLQAVVIREPFLLTISEKLVRLNSEPQDNDFGPAARQAFRDLLIRFATTLGHSALVQSAANSIGVELNEIEHLLPAPVPQTSGRSAQKHKPILQDEHTGALNVCEMDSTLTSPQNASSFLSPSLRNEAKKYLVVFDKCCTSDKHSKQLFDHLKQRDWYQSPALLTLMARIWTSSMLSSSRSQAIEIAIDSVRSGQHQDYSIIQVVLPYVLIALNDSSQRVRKSAADMCIAIGKSRTFEANQHTSSWLAAHLYGSQIAELEIEDKIFSKLISNIELEATVLDRNHIIMSVSKTLNGESGSISLKSNTRLTICTALAAHAAYTPSLQVTLGLVKILHRCSKVPQVGRVKFLLPTTKHWLGLERVQAALSCADENVSIDEMDETLVGCISHRTNEELLYLESVVSGQSIIRQEAAELVFSRVKSLLHRMSSESDMHLAEVLLNTALDQSRRNGVVDYIALSLDVLRNAELTTNTLIHFIDISRANDQQDQAPSAKRQKLGSKETSGTTKHDDQNLQTVVRRMTAVLELVESHRPERRPELINSLFQFLGDLHHIKNLMSSELVYTQGLLLGCLYSAFEGIKSITSFDLDTSVVRMDLIVDSIRSTSSPQVYNTGLLLISRVAALKPDLVLHSVMPLFTFMGSTLLKQSDDYSAYVADQTVASIVPPLAASLKRNGTDIVTGASNLLLSFAAAYEHMLLHRRGPLFEQLVNILGCDETLYAVMTLLIAKYHGVDSEVLSFLANLMNRFPASNSLIAARECLGVVSDTLKPRRGKASLLLGLDESPEDLQEATEALIEGLASLLQSEVLRKSLARDLLKGSTTSSIRSLYADLLEKTMQLKQSLLERVDLQPAADALLSAVLGLLPTKDFIESSAQLMQTGSDLTRQRVFASLESRVLRAKAGDTTLQEVFIEVLPNCCVFISETQPVAVRHAAISCIDQICVKFGKIAKDAAFAAARQVAGAAALGSRVESLQIVSMLCLSSTIEILGEEVLGILPEVLAQARSHLRSDKSSIEVQNAAFALLGAVLDYLPWVFTTNYLDEALTSLANMSDRLNNNVLASGTDFSNMVPKKVDASELYVSIEHAWHAVDDPNAKQLLLSISHQSILRNTKSTIIKNASKLFEILLLACKLRAQLTENGEQISDLFALIDTVALDMVLKLNDATFRPFFIRMIEWAEGQPSEQPRTHCLLSVYRLTLHLFSQLKSVITSYASFVLDGAASALKHRPADSVNGSLLEITLKVLSSSFNHDQDDFWQTPAHFDAIAAPLLATLAFTNQYSNSNLSISTITDFAVAASSPDHYKTINSTLMSYMRHQDAAVRLAAVKCERGITEKLNFDWLALLPEMLPFISELQEDEDEAVERETLRWVKQIEDTTGESLEGMLA